MLSLPCSLQTSWSSSAERTVTVFRRIQYYSSSASSSSICKCFDVHFLEGFSMQTVASFTKESGGGGGWWWWWMPTKWCGSRKCFRWIVNWFRAKRWRRGWIVCKCFRRGWNQQHINRGRYLSNNDGHSLDRCGGGGRVLVRVVTGDR